jgi:hypothetical protein
MEPCSINAGFPSDNSVPLRLKMEMVRRARLAEGLGAYSTSGLNMAGALAGATWVESMLSEVKTAVIEVGVDGEWVRMNVIASPIVWTREVSRLEKGGRLEPVVGT